MKHLEESHKHLEDEHDMDTQLEREFQEKQELEEQRELCLALQMDSECLQTRKPLTKVRAAHFCIGKKVTRVLGFITAIKFYL